MFSLFVFLADFSAIFVFSFILLALWEDLVTFDYTNDTHLTQYQLTTAFSLPSFLLHCVSRIFCMVYVCKNTV